MHQNVSIVFCFNAYPFAYFYVDGVEPMQTTLFSFH